MYKADAYVLRPPDEQQPKRKEAQKWTKRSAEKEKRSEKFWQFNVRATSVTWISEGTRELPYEC